MSQHEDLAPNLDILRAFAVGFVFISHLVGWTAQVRQGLGRFGVLIFFVHTSLVLMMSLERMKLHGRTLFSTFYVRRAFRIYPLSIAAVLVMVLLKLPSDATGTYKELPFGDFISNVLLTQNLTKSPSALGPLWSLPYEVQMYLVLPAIYLLVRRRAAWNVFALWVVVAAAAVPSMPPLLSLMSFAPCFIAGILAYRLKPTGRMPAWLWPCTIIGLAVAFTCFPGERKYEGWVGCLILGVLIPQFRVISGRVITVPAHLIAKYSYGIYLSHGPLSWFAFHYVQAPKMVRWGIFLPLAAAVPVLAYHAIEDPLIRTGSRIAREIAVWSKARIVCANSSPVAPRVP